MKTITLPIRGLISEISETAPDFMRLRPAVLFFPVYKKINSKGLSPIYCRITINGSRAEFSTGITIRRGEFENGSLLQTAEGFEVKNNELHFIENELQKICLQLRIGNAVLTADKMRELFLKPAPVIVPFYSLLKEFVDYKINKVNSNNTKRTYKPRFKNITAFFSKRNLLSLSATELTTEIIESLELWLREKGFKYVYINRHLKLIEGTIKKAISKGIISHNVLSGYEFSHDPPKKIIALSKKELALLEKKKFVSEKLQRVADLYIFCCYTSFAYADLVEFDFEKHTRIIDGKRWIDKARHKSHIEQITPLFPKAEEILKKYNYKLPVISFQKYNDYIKEIADIVGIEKHLTPHTARKTFAMIRIEEGYTFDVTAKMMGHTSSKQTENTYAKVTHKRIQVEMKKNAA